MPYRLRKTSSLHKPGVARIIAAPGGSFTPSVLPIKEASGGQQSLILGLFSNIGVFPSAVVGRGVVGLSPPAHINNSSFLTTVITQSQLLLPLIFTNPSTWYTPTIVTGVVNLDASIFINTSMFPTAVVGRGTVNISPSIFTSTVVFYSPTVTLIGGVSSSRNRMLLGVGI